MYPTMSTSFVSWSQTIAATRPRSSNFTWSMYIPQYLPELFLP